MASSTIVSVRLQRELLDQLTKVAKEEQRSLSGQIVYSIRQALRPYSRRVKPRRTMGWLRGHRVPTDEQFVQIRRELSRSLSRRTL